MIVPKRKGRSKHRGKSNNTYHIKNDQGTIRHVLKATVDHVSPISITDPKIVNDLNNLVAACQTCNQRRAETPKKLDKVCKSCKTTIVKTIGCCNACRVENYVFFELMKVTRT